VLTVVTWKWGARPFNAGDVNRLRAALERHLHLPHELVCITDDPEGIDRRVRIVPMPETFAATPRCRRRMQVFSRAFAEQLGARLLCIDLDVVIVDDLTPIVSKRGPLVCWRVGYAGVFSGSFVLMDAGVLDDLWLRFAADPEGYPRTIQAHGTPSDQAMLNAFLSGRTVPHWTERDGFVTYFGSGYERLEHHGVGPGRPALPAGARIVVLGSADKAVLEEGSFDWVRKHWTALPAEAGR
jgi:hypothetical protein